MNRYFFHSALFRLVAPAIYGMILYLLILLINNNVSQVNGIFITEELYVCVLLTYLAFEVIRGVIVLIHLMLKEKPPAIIIPLQLASTTLLSVGLVILSLMAYFHLVVGFSISASQLTVFFALFTVTALVYNLLYFSNYYVNKENTLKIHAENQQRTVLEMEMSEYKNDINPDLLYESLENVIGLMYRDVESAEDYLDCLGSAYRYVLTNRQNELVPADEEFEAARNIIRLLNERYGGQLRLECELSDDDLKAMLIPGSLPVTLENAIRNSIITRHEPFVIHCYREYNYLTIETRLNDRLLMHEASEEAFARLQRSYSLFTDLPLIKVKAYEQNYVKLPLITLGKDTEVIG